MAGGRIVLRHPRDARPSSAKDTVIMGNTCLYGATGGELFAAGLAGERFAVRNSGALAVIEGAGRSLLRIHDRRASSSCSARTGAEFRCRLHRRLRLRARPGARFRRPLQPRADRHQPHPRPRRCRSTCSTCETCIEQHVAETGSVWGGADPRTTSAPTSAKFWVVKPKAASIDSLIENLRRAA